jgi:hypothetical protein
MRAEQTTALAHEAYIRLVDHARRHNLKRGGSVAQIDPRKVQVVEMRFGGLELEDTAEALKVSPVTVKRDWTGARARLHFETTHLEATHREMTHHEMTGGAH